MWLQAVTLAAAGAAVVEAQQGGGSTFVQAAYPDATYPDAISPNPITVAGSQSNQKSPDKFPSPWGEGLGNWAGAYAKAQALVGQMTLTEKVNLTTGVGWQSERCVGQTGSVPRLGIRSLCLQDSPLGVRFADYVSAFPAGVNTAATWNRQLAQARGVGMGQEHQGKGVDIQLGPATGPLGRQPEGGRNWEGFAADPYLSGQMIAETVTGIQSQGVIACSKHYIFNEQEHFRSYPQAPYNITDASSSNVDDVTLHEAYLWPFADAVRAGTGAIMCSYNQANNSYACQNSYLMNYILKSELSFQGFIVSDWSGQHSGVLSALSGLDMTMPGDVAFNSNTSFWGGNLTVAVLNGTVPQYRIDDAVVRILAAWYYVGRDTKAVPINFDSWTRTVFGPRNFIAKTNNELVNERVDVRGEHDSIIRDVGRQSTVLLKNANKALPLTGKEKFTAVIGKDAGPNPDGPNGCSDRGCNNGTLAMGWGSGTADFPYLITPDTAIQNRVVAKGGRYESILDNNADTQISTLVPQASVVIVFVNADSGEGYITVDGNAGDRNNLTLWEQGDALIKNVTALNNNTIVVVHSVGAVLLEDIKNNPNVTALLWAGLPGQETGNTIADVLYGDCNPGGKLPFTIGKNRTDYGTDVLYQPNQPVPQIDYKEGVFFDYRGFDKRNVTPTYEFGYGISYTEFSYSNLVVNALQAGPYTPTTGETPPAPTYGTVSNNPADYLFPTDLVQIPYYIYPYLNNTDLQAASGDPAYNTLPPPPGSRDASPQPRNPAGGAPGGNPGLWDVLYTVSATISNTGSVDGDEVVQLYFSQGGPYDPVRVLRGFDRLHIPAGGSATFTANLTRKDVSSWDTVSQNWVISDYPKTVYVGASSRILPLSQALPLIPSGGSGGGPSGYPTGPASSPTKMPYSGTSPYYKIDW